MNPRLTRCFSATCGVVLLLFAAPTQADHLRNLNPGDAVPDFSLKTLDGGTLESAALRGKVLMLVFLSVEQTSSERAAISAHEVLGRIHRDDLALAFVTSDATQSGYFRQQRDKSGVHEPLALDIDRQFYGKLGVIVLPTTLVVQRDGKLATVISGYKSDYAHVLETQARLALGDIDEAEAKKRLSSEVFRRDRPADRAARHRAAAQLLREKGLLADAEKELKSALECDPTLADVGLDLASLYLLQKRTTEAGALVDGILKADPANRQAKLTRGIVLLRSGSYDQAESILQEALGLNPDPARTHYYLGVLYEKTGKPEKALYHYRQALSRLLDDASE